MRVTKLSKDADGHWSANVSVNGSTRTFHDRFGSWMTERRRSDDWPPTVARREALPPVAALLSGKLPYAERGRR